MSNLVSPGVSVTVTDESFYASAGNGTVPLIFVATKQDKLNSSGDAIADGTTKENAGKLWIMTSQRELLQTFGIPEFHSAGGSGLHGYALNEYGLLSAHSYLGSSNRAYIVRADVDLGELDPLTSPPSSPPSDGTSWLDLNSTKFGAFAYEAGTGWVEADMAVAETVDSSGKPVGVVNDYAVVPGVSEVGTENKMFKYIPGSGYVPLTKSEVVYSPHTSIPSAGDQGKLWIKTTVPNNGAYYMVREYDASIGTYVEVEAPLYSNGDSAIDSMGAMEGGQVIVAYNATPDDTSNVVHQLMEHNGNASTVAEGVVNNPTTSTTGIVVINNTNVSLSSGMDVYQIVDSINIANIPAIVASVSSSNAVILTNSDSKDVSIDASSNGQLVGEIGFEVGVYSNWDHMSYVASNNAPDNDPIDGTRWYDPSFNIDILVNDGAGAWQDMSGMLYIQPSEPDAPIDGDVWVDTDQLETYPVIHRYANGNWVLTDNTDQTTENGIVFADARPENTGILDPDAPDALAYPEGMLLWNTRYSTRNVKRFVKDYTYQGQLVGDRWVTESRLELDGSPKMGHDAVKDIVVQAMQAVVVNNQDIRADSIVYNLITAPGYVELVDEMVSLNIDKKETAFVIGDSPFTLDSSATSLQNWASNAGIASTNGNNGLVTYDEYLGVYYPAGLTTNVDGTEVVVPPSHMALNTIAYNDQVAYPWFAPAGFHRGIVTNATSVGYVDGEGEYVPVELNEGTRDVLYSNSINPITPIPNRGLTVFGQKTRSSVSSALDRINVARLVNYVRYQADLLAQPFLFEPNDKSTRDNVVSAYNSFLSQIMLLRGITDFLVVCDTSNNTPARIDRNELWVDIAIVPTKAVEFIYIPIRIKNTGSI